MSRLVLQALRERAAALKRETMALYYAARDPATPWYAKAVVLFAVGYALSPIDPIPDFIPVLGLIDELILLPLALALAIRLIPAPVMASARERVQAQATAPRNYTAAAVIVALWVAAAAFTAWMVHRVW